MTLPKGEDVRTEESGARTGGGLLGGAPVHLCELGEGVGLLDALYDPALLDPRIVEHVRFVGASGGEPRRSDPSSCP